jgi:hypothetical protein
LLNLSLADALNAHHQNNQALTLIVEQLLVESGVDVEFQSFPKHSSPFP